MHRSRYSATVLPVDEGLTAEIVAAEADLRGPSPDAWFDRLDRESNSLEAALGSALEHDQEQGLRLAAAVWPYWMARGKVETGRAWPGRERGTPRPICRDWVMAWMRLCSSATPDRRPMSSSAAIR